MEGQTVYIILNERSREFAEKVKVENRIDSGHQQFDVSVSLETERQSKG